MINIYLSIHLLISITLIYNSINPKRWTRFLYIISFLIPLQGLSIKSFVLFSWYKIILIFSLIGIIVTGYKAKNKKLPAISIFVIFLSYITFLTLVSWLYDINYSNNINLGISLGWGDAQTVFRYPVQLISYYLVWGTIFISVLYVNSKDKLKAIINGYITGCLLSVLVGFYQMLAVKYNFFWITNLDISGFLSSGLANRARFSSLQIPRLYGLGGEPKHTASYTIIALALILSIYIFKSDIKVNKPIIKIIILIVGTICTGSTGGLFALGFIVIYYFIFAVFINAKLRIKNILKVIPITITIFLVIFIIVGPHKINNFYQERILNKTKDIEKIFYYEPKDGALIKYALEQPENIFFGSGTGGIDFHLIRYTPSFYLEYGGTTTPAYLFTRLIGDIGIIGTILIFMMFFKWFYVFKKNKDIYMLNFGVSCLGSLFLVTFVSLSAYLIILSSMVMVSENNDSLSIKLGV